MASQRSWLGSIGGREAELVSRAGISFRGVPTGAVLGRDPFQLVVSLARNARGVAAARAAIQEIEPDVVLATGGYVSVPAVVAASTLGVPTLLFLPDVRPGLAVRALSLIANRVACTAEATRRYLPANKVVATGYPLRPELRAWAKGPDGRARARVALDLPLDRPVVLVMGGSTGARSINRALLNSLPRLLAATFVHVAGADGIAAAEAARGRLAPVERPRYRPYPYLHDEMGAALAAADIVVCRAGASVLGELPAFGLPGILIPGRFAGGHQLHNAQHLAAAGAAVVVDDDLLELEDTLPNAISHLLTEPGRLATMARAARALDRPDAADQISALLRGLAAGR
jgi:UDP-N-acetylglucosamine--N-acetylmuramyl-(pentapeptide) pyrophosphoryl-undecaprenol N-acetylglucosamine transferase